MMMEYCKLLRESDYNLKRGRKKAVAVRKQRRWCCRRVFLEEVQHDETRTSNVTALNLLGIKEGEGSGFGSSSQAMTRHEGHVDNQH